MSKIIFHSTFFRNAVNSANSNFYFFVYKNFNENFNLLFTRNNIQNQYFEDFVVSLSILQLFIARNIKISFNWFFKQSTIGDKKILAYDLKNKKKFQFESFQQYLEVQDLSDLEIPSLCAPIGSVFSWETGRRQECLHPQGPLGNLSSRRVVRQNF